MSEKTVDKSARAMHRQIAKRAWDFRMAGKSEPLLTAFKEFDALARDLGYGSASELWGAVSTTRKSKNGTDSAKLAVNTNGSAKTAVIKPASAKDRYKALIVHKDTFVPADPTMAALLKVSLARISHIRSELGTEGFAFAKVENGFFASPPEPKPAPIEPDPPENVVEAQLPLPAPTIEPVATTVTGTLEEAPGVALVVTESDLAVVVKKLAHIETLLDWLPSMAELLTDLYVQNNRHHEASSSEQRQLRALVAQLLQKWN